MQPFPIKIASVHPNGGVVNCLRVYIARVYPIKYFEKLPNGSGACDYFMSSSIVLKVLIFSLAQFEGRGEATYGFREDEVSGSGKIAM